MDYSDNERAYCRACLASDKRTDGRRARQRRPVSLQVGIALQSHGSARLRVGDCTTSDGLDVIVGCKLETADARAQLTASVECPGASQNSFQAIEGLILTLFHHLEQSSQFCIIPNAKYWSLHIEVVVMAGPTSSNNIHLADPIILATRAALCDLRIPQTQALSAIAPAESEGAQDQGLKALLKGGKTKSNTRSKSDKNAFELASYVDLGEPLENIDDLPLCVTLFIILKSSEVQNTEQKMTFFIDATALEASASDAALTIAVDGNNNVCAVQLHGSKELPYDELAHLIEIATTEAGEMIQAHDARLGSNQSMES